MGNIFSGSTTGSKVIKDRQGYAQAKASSGDQANTNSPAVKKIAVPKGTQDHTDPTTDADDSHRSMGY